MASVRRALARARALTLSGLSKQVVELPRGSGDVGHCQAIGNDGALAAGSDHRADGLSANHIR